MALAPSESFDAPDLAVTRMASALGAEIRGLDLRVASPETATLISELLKEHLVLFFPDQHLSQEQHVSLGRLFGPLEYLTGFVANERFTVRHNWSKGTIAMWDNRCTQHRVLNDFDEERIIQRVTIMGDKPSGDTPRWTPWSGARLGATSRFDRQLALYLRDQDGAESSAVDQLVGNEDSAR